MHLTIAMSSDKFHTESYHKWSHTLGNLLDELWREMMAVETITLKNKTFYAKMEIFAGRKFLDFYARKN